jgi:uncharacterized protein
VNKKYTHDLTPLMWASGYGKNDAVTLLLNAGADANIQDDRGQNALMMATSAGYVDVVTQLLNHGAQPELKDNSGKSAFDLASEAKNEALILVLKTAM